MRCAQIYMFNSQRLLLSRQGRRALGPRGAGVSLSGPGPQLRGGGGAWAPLERGARGGFRCAREVRGLRCPTGAVGGVASWAPAGPSARTVLLPLLQEAPPRPAWPSLGFPNCTLGDRLLVSHYLQGAGGDLG